MVYTGMRALLLLLYALIDTATKRFDPKRTRTKETTDVCPPTVMVTPTSVATDAFDFLHDDEWETASTTTTTMNTFTLMKTE